MLKLLATDGEGERLDRFELIAELASGGMATVYLARLSGVAGFQRLVAIKRLHPHLANEPEFMEMFLDEARLAARIHHPNVVPIQEVGESDAGYYLVMDYVEGDTFARLLSRAVQTDTSVPLGVTVRILIDTLAGLHSAHELTDDFGQPLAIVHRDVSPQNILVGTDGIARIADFGVARAASRLSTTRSGQLKGKLAYMAPEQARGEGIDRRADVFACGIVLWEALARRRLFRAEGEASTLNRVLSEPIAAPSVHRPEVPKELEAVCMRALERDVDKRFATAEAFADELETVARRLSCVGSVREVVVCLEQVFGADLVQQRDVVRAWLARSEPSGVAPRVARRLPDSGATHVEGPKAEAERANAPRVDRSAVTAPAPPERGALDAENAPSVASAVLHVAGSAEGAASAPRSPRGALRIAAVFAAAVLALGVVVGGTSWLRDRDPDAGAGVMPAPPPSLPPGIDTNDAPAPVTEPPAERSAAPSPPSASDAGGHARVGDERSPVKMGGKRTGAASKAPGAGSKPSAATAMPDDLSKNPYR